MGKAHVKIPNFAEIQQLDDTVVLSIPDMERLTNRSGTSLRRSIMTGVIVGRKIAGSWYVSGRELKRAFSFDGDEI